MSNAKNDTSLTRVLIVEDDADLRELMSEILSDEGFHVSAAAEGAEALAHVKSNPMPQLILMDLSLPGMSGEEFMAHLSEHPERRRAKVVVVSGWDDIAVKAEKLGADGFMKKPLELNSISVTLAKILGTR